MKMISNLFKRKQNKKSIHDDEFVDIPVYGPHDNILPVPYAASGYFAEFEIGFEVRCREFLSKTQLDKYNRSYMDLLVDHMVKEALGLLDVQEIGHRNAINQLARTRSSDINDAKTRLEQIQAERVSLNTNIAKLEKIYNKGTAFEDYENVDREEARK